MGNSIFNITHNHGREMYLIGLESAISAIEILGGDDALEHLRAKLMAERKELADERAQQV